MKRLGVALGMLAALLLFGSCGGSGGDDGPVLDAALIGTWEGDPSPMRIVFNSDGTFSLTMFPMTARTAALLPLESCTNAGTWTADGSQVTLTYTVAGCQDVTVGDVETDGYVRYTLRDNPWVTFTADVDGTPTEYVFRKRLLAPPSLTYPGTADGSFWWFDVYHYTPVAAFAFFYDGTAVAYYEEGNCGCFAAGTFADLGDKLAFTITAQDTSVCEAGGDQDMPGVGTTTVHAMEFEPWEGANLLLWEGAEPIGEPAPFFMGSSACGGVPL